MAVCRLLTLKVYFPKSLPLWHASYPYTDGANDRNQTIVTKAWSGRIYKISMSEKDIATVGILALKVLGFKGLKP